MRNAGNKRLLVLLLTLAMLACGVVALGGTFASQVELIGDPTSVPGDKPYAVTVKYHDGNGYNRSLLDQDSTALSNVLWCPGYTEIIYLKLVNEETFPVKCELDIVVNESEFGKMLSYAVIDGLQPRAKDHPTNWMDFKNRANISDILEKSSIIEQERDLFDITKEVLLTPGDASARYYALAIHMDEDATNEYQEKSMEVSFDLRINADYAPGENPSD